MTTRNDDVKPVMMDGKNNERMSDNDVLVKVFKYVSDSLNAGNDPANCLYRGMSIVDFLGSVGVISRKRANEELDYFESRRNAILNARKGE